MIDIDDVLTDEPDDGFLTRQAELALARANGLRNGLAIGGCAGAIMGALSIVAVWALAQALA